MGLITQLILSRLIFRKWFKVSEWKNYSQSGDEDDNPLVKKGLANIFVGVCVIIGVSALRYKGYL